MTLSGPFKTFLFTAANPGRLAMSLALILVAKGPALHAQNTPAFPAPSAGSAPWQLASASSSSTDAAAPADLPDAPAPQPASQHPGTPGNAPAARVAPIKTKYIPPGWTAQPLGAKGKFEVASGDLISLKQFGAVILSSGWEQLWNSEPNYGTDRGAFGERLGAAELREDAQGVLSDGIFAVLFHEDPRFYEQGPSHSPVNRTMHAITRVFVTRSDDGAHTVNAALLVGYAGAAALTPLYYPPLNRNAHDVLSVYGGSLGGAALDYLINEFKGDLLGPLHLSHNR